MKLFYKEPSYMGGIATIIMIVGVFIDIYLIIFTNDWWFRVSLMLITYFIYVKHYHKTYLYEEKIIVKYSKLKLKNKFKEVNYKDCLIFEDANVPYAWNNYNITYRIGKEKQKIGFHILEEEKINDVINFLELKNNRIKIKVNSSLY